MRPISRALLVMSVLVSGSVVGCRRAIVIVPQRDAGYTAKDTLYGSRDGKNVRVTFRHDTTWRVDTVLRLDTLWRAGRRVDTVLFTRVDTLYSGYPLGRPRRDTVLRRDTVRVIVRDTVRIGIGRRDTVWITRVDTLRFLARDTVVRVDTVRTGGQRILFVPPGQYPPEGQCRVWIHNLPPGQQARAAACDELGAIPAGAFVLFSGEAWDLDFDWLAHGGAPPQIVALRRRRGR